jgi:hypothetical protein
MAMAMGQSNPALELKSRIVIPNVTGRMDHVGVDVKGQRLFMTAFNNNTAEVIDLRLGARFGRFQTWRILRERSTIPPPIGYLSPPARMER